MASTTRKTIGPTVGTGANATLYTVPANTIARVTQIHLANSAAIGVSSSAQVALNGAPATGTAIVPTTHTIAGGAVEDYYGAPTGYMLVAAGTIQANLATTVAATINVEETVLG